MVICMCACVDVEKEKREEAVTVRPKLGTFVAARHFSRQPAEVTAKAGERQVADSQD